ncbi:hypothetical protein G6F65_019484 [Rhizopus arrhizus]|nr:hypothetical protein G6F65_019484 [Rhizopus arrhizus]
MAEEHVFVPRPGSRNADDGWLIGTLLDPVNTRSGLAVLDARHLDDGPIAQAWLPYAACWGSPSYGARHVPGRPSKRAGTAGIPARGDQPGQSGAGTGRRAFAAWPHAGTGHRIGATDGGAGPLHLSRRSSLGGCCGQPGRMGPGLPGD